MLPELSCWIPQCFKNISWNFRMLLIQVVHMFSAKHLTKLWRVCTYIRIVQERKPMDKVLFVTQKKSSLSFVSANDA